MFIERKFVLKIIIPCFLAEKDDSNSQGDVCLFKIMWEMWSVAP